jgi:hypothetical protein
VIEWSPDDTAILMMPIEPGGAQLPHVLWNLATGEAADVPWAARSVSSWQRIAT